MSTGKVRVRVFTDPKGEAVGETTFMVEDYIPERLEFDVTSKDKVIKAEAPVELKVAGHFLYGAPASNLQLEGDMLVGPAEGRADFPGYEFGVDDTDTSSNEGPIELCPAILPRTAGKMTVTDDNMGSEWRRILGLE